MGMCSKDDHESVYNLVRPPSPQEVKHPRYESKHSKSIQMEFRDASKKLEHQTMGEAPKVEPPDPENFLRKHTREVKFQQRAKSARAHRDPPDAHCHDRRPPVPRVTDHVATPLRHRRNFLRVNAIDVMCAKKMTPDDPKFVDAPDGHLQSLVHSGMQPVFKDKKTFGRVPGYLQRFRRAKEEDQLRWEEERRQERDRMESMKLSKEEREGILEGLQTNWSEVHHQYQKLSLLTDTLPKKIRREQIEAQLDELEKYVALIERHPVIIVSDNSFYTF